MNTFSILFDVGVPGGGVAVASVGVAFILVVSAFAFLAYRMLRKTLKWTFRMAIGGVILMVALIGGGLMIWLSMNVTPARRPEPTRQR